MMRVLHVDDEPDIREIARVALGDVGGLEVVSAGSGVEGLREAASWKPDLILLDVMMPGMDGPTTLTRLRDCPDTAGIPVIFMTAKVRGHEIDHYMTLGAMGVISKPFDPMTLADEVRTIWDARVAGGGHGR